MMRPPERVEIPEAEPPRRRWEQVLAVLIVITTLCIAGVEFLHGNEEHRAHTAGEDAQRLAVEQQGAQDRIAERARAMVTSFETTETERQRQGNAFQESLLPSISAGSTELTQLGLEGQRWRQLADATQQLTPVSDDSPTGPYLDTSYPARALLAGQDKARGLLARQDIANAEREDWEARLSRYSVILTVLAVAVYLFGLALTLSGGVRRLLAGLGVVLLVGGVAVAGVMQLRRPSPPPDSVADDYAAGEYAFEVATLSNDPQGFREADAELTRAIQGWPDFSRAFLERSAVRFFMGAPPNPQDFGSTSSVAGHEAALADVEQALDTGMRTAVTYDDRGFERTVLGVLQKRGDVLDAAGPDLAQGLQLDPNNPAAHFNDGLWLLAEGRTDDALAEYRAATDRVVYLDVARRTPRHDVAYQEDLVASALADIDMLQQHRPDLAGAARRAKAAVVGAVQGGLAPNRQPPPVKLVAYAYPQGLVWDDQDTGLDLTRHAVSTQWYYRATDRDDWSVVAGLSGVAPQGYGPAPRLIQGPPAYYSFYSNSLIDTKTCIPAGSWRVEVYIDGALAGEQTAQAATGDLATGNLRDESSLFCRLPDWTRLSADKRLTGVLDGYASPDGRRGAMVIRIDNQFSGGAAGFTDSLQEALRSFAVQHVASHGLLPGTPVADHAATSDFYPPSAGLQGKAEYYRVGSDEAMLTDVTAFADGTAFIGLVYGPAGEFQPGGAGLPQVFASLTFVRSS